MNLRTCIVTRTARPRHELVRIVHTKDQQFLVNSSAKGRGAYVAKDVVDPHKINKYRLLHRAFKTQVPNIVYEQLLAFLKEVKHGQR